MEITKTARSMSITEPGSIRRVKNTTVPTRAAVAAICPQRQ